MTTKVWTFDLEDGKHTVELEHGVYSGKRAIQIDGVPLELPRGERQNLFDMGSDHVFDVAGHQGRITIRTNGFTFKYDLVIDDRSLTMGQNAVAPRLPIPGWAWIFIIACGAIPFITLGGAIPAMIGFVAAGYCAQTSRDGGKTTDVRVIMCVAITALVWILLFIFIVGVGTLTGR